ncbi:MAG: zf-HC2 domain-containing protein [Bacteroidetes bacterium]|nr:zf-HC2 domain-containing protein [Bacteroidota bacterium]
MKDRLAHCTFDQLQARMDGRLDEEQSRIIEEHLGVCSECRKAAERWLRFDRALRGLPLVRASSSMTYSVMARIQREPNPSTVDRYLSYIPYVFGLVIVLGIMLGAFGWAGLFEGAEASEGEQRVLEQLSWGAGQVSYGLEAVGQWLMEYLPFAFSETTMGITVLSGLILAIVAALDRVLGRRHLGGAR